MSLYKELSYEGDIDTVKRVQFCVMSPDEIIKRSVVEVTRTDTYVGNEPVLNGLFDQRMGVIDFNKVCMTCEQKNTFCPGHFGHIALAKPVFYAQFFDQVKKILKCICFRCSKLLVPPDSDVYTSMQGKKISRQKRWEVMYKLCSKYHVCDARHGGCGARNPDKISRSQDKVMRILMEWKETTVDAPEGNRRHVLSAEDVLKILRRISDVDCEAIGFHPRLNRPEWMICTVLPVPPPAVRPTVKVETGQRQEDDLTHKLVAIIKTNNHLKQKLERSTKEQVEMMLSVLQWDVATFIDNNITGISPAQQRTGRPIRSLTERLKSKEGRIRGNLMGKRVDFSARSVITPDPCISIDELGVPLKIAMNMTFPEILNRFNKDKLVQAIKNGPDTYPGAKYVRKSRSGRTLRLRSVPDIDEVIRELEYGDIVERHLVNGDYVLFNRQPSLHKMSMMGHRVRVMPHNTFRLNVCVTPSFNADFDGDEMNMHVPQSLQTFEELRSLTAVPTQIISPRTGQPIISIVQDITLGVYRLTKDNVSVPLRHFMNLLSPNTCLGADELQRWVNHVKAKGVATGKEVLSTVLPALLNHEAKGVVIRNGELVSGTITKSSYQDQTTGLLHSVFNEIGSDAARMFLDNTQRLICDWLVLSGFSVGIADLALDPATRDMCGVKVKEMREDVMNLIRMVHAGKFENTSTMSNGEFFEQAMQSKLQNLRESISKMATQVIQDNNCMMNMIRAKSKGNDLNMTQMVGCLGQQAVEGKRIPYGFEGRTLPHFCKYDDGPDSRGFVENSFIGGLTPQEFFFHSMGGREGLIDTAVRTSETGYLQRKLVKAMEDCKVFHDGTVRNAAGAIVQFLYGEDGMDATKIESQEVPYVLMDPLRMQDEFLIKSIEDFTGQLDDGVMERLRESGSDFIERAHAHYGQLLDDRNFLIKRIFKTKYDKTIIYPVAFHRILSSASMMFRMAGSATEVDLDPEYVLNSIDRVCDSVRITARPQEGMRFMQILTRCFLSPKYLLSTYPMDSKAFDLVVRRIQDRFKESLVQPGELVGIVAAQSIGEPTTQLTLNSVVWGERILLRSATTDVQVVKIGEYIDQLLAGAASDKVQHLQENQTEYLDVTDMHVDVPCVDEKGRMHWKRVEAITRHDVGCGLVQVRTRSGRVVTATKSKSFLVRENNLIVPKRGQDIKVGDHLPVTYRAPALDDYIYEVDVPVIGTRVKLDRDYGYHVGCTLLQEIPSWALAACNEFVVGLLDGFFSVHGTVVDHEITAPAATYVLGLGLAELLARFDIAADVFPHVVVRDWNVVRFVQHIKLSNRQLHASLVKVTEDSFYQDRFDDIPGVSIGKFHGTYSCCDLARFARDAQDPDEGTRLWDTINTDVFFDQVVQVTDVIPDQAHPKVYDFTVSDTRNFTLYGGLCMRDTFHMSGIASASKAVRGVPRLKELLECTKTIKTPFMTIYLKPEYGRDKRRCLEIMHALQMIKLKDVLVASRIYFDPYDPETQGFRTNINEDSAFVKAFKEFQQLADIADPASLSPWLVRLQLDRSKVLDLGLSVLDVRRALDDAAFASQLECVYPDDNAENLVFRIRLAADSDEDMSDMLTTIKAFEESIIEGTILSGVKDIHKVSVDVVRIGKDEDRDKDPEAPEYSLMTVGTNLIDILGCSCIDATRTKTNDVVEILHVLGIEAARQALYNEITEVLGEQGVNHRHLCLLVDTMTHRGSLASINRHGISQGDIGPLAKCSFEAMTERIVKAGMFAEVDRITGVSANVMLGQIAPCGTGDTRVMMDDAMLEGGHDDNIVQGDVDGDNEIDMGAVFSFDIRDVAPAPTLL